MMAVKKQRLTLSLDWGEQVAYRYFRSETQENQSREETKKVSILALSGLGWNHELYASLAPKILNSPLVRDILVLDNRGMGESLFKPDSKLEDKNFTIKDLALDAKEWTQDLEPYFLIGISLGGFIAQELLLLDSQKIIGASLLCTTSTLHGTNKIWEHVALPALTEEMLRASYQIPTDKRSELSIDAIVHPSFKLLNEKAYMDLVNLRSKTWPEEDYLILQKKAADIFLSQRKLDLDTVSCPVQCLSGDADRFVDPRNSEILLGRMNGQSKGRIDLVKDTDHMFFFEKPNDVANKINDFLNSLLSGEQ